MAAALRTSIARRHRMCSRGFTLVEMLVALFAMALLAVLSWQGLDGMMRARQSTEARADEVLTLQTGLAQWGADLDAIAEFPPAPALEWNGRVLRLTRRSSLAPEDGARVVAWTRRDGQWLRWESQPVLTKGDLDAAWAQADVWSQNATPVLRSQEVAVTPLEEWQIFFFRCNAWTNPQSSAAGSCGNSTAATNVAVAPSVPASGTTTSTAAVTPTAVVTPIAANVLPDGVRLVLQLPPGRALAGRLQRDWLHNTVTP